MGTNTNQRTTNGANSDKVTKYGWKALAGSTVGYAMDGFDLLILGFMLSAISADLNLSPTQAGSLVTWTLVGAVAGGLIFGLLWYLVTRPKGSELEGLERKEAELRTDRHKAAGVFYGEW